MLADGGSEGMIVVGQKIFRKYANFLVANKICALSDIKELPKSNILYKFGAGARCCVRSVLVPMPDFSS